jgi:hypothetical protein
LNAARAPQLKASVRHLAYFRKETPMRFRPSARTIGIVLVIGTLIFVMVSVGTATNQEKAVYKPTGSEATIFGTISFVGTPPQPLVIDMSADPICENVNADRTSDWVVVTDHKLANVVVYVRSDGLNAYSFDAPSAEVTLAHRGCQLVPHVMGMLTQQTLRILNSDPTTHNSHAISKNNRDWNQSQPPGAAALEQHFSLPELFIPIKDNQHPWEKAYVGVFSHPFYSVSATDGSYRISGLPLGQYTIVAWHEKFGEQTVDAFLAGNEQKNLDFTFKASDH